MYVFKISFEKISCFFCLILSVSVQTFSLLKQYFDLFPFSLHFFFLLCSLFLCPLFMFTLLVVTLLILFFSTFALLMFISTLLCFFCLCSFFFFCETIFESPLFIFLSVKLCLFCLLFLFRTLFILLFYFNRVLSNKINWPFFGWQKNHVFNTSKNLSFEFLLFDISKKKSFIIFRFSIFFFELLGKLLFLFFSWKTILFTKIALATKNKFVQISFFGNLFVFRKISVSPAFSEKVCFYYLLLVFFHLKIDFLKNRHRKNGVLEKKKLFLSPLDFSFLLKKLISIFQLS